MDEITPTPQNVQPGFYLHHSEESKTYFLLHVKSKNVILHRINKSW